ncbi:RDD family protein [Rhodobacteraceae bacterium NNCM2]|nr:RDD family protein [Coraliihabitans acroporae]
MSLPDPHHDPQFYEGVPARRFVAFVIDSIIIAVLMGLILVAAMIVGFLTLGLGWIVGLGLFFVTGFLYRVFFLSQNSATLGMGFVGIEIRDRTGEPLDPPTALVHTAGYYITTMFPLLLVGGWALMFASPHRRLLHDWLPGTAAINRPL